jgi:hypothetical protein
MSSLICLKFICTVFNENKGSSLADQGLGFASIWLITNVG